MVLLLPVLRSFLLLLSGSLAAQGNVAANDRWSVVTTYRGNYTPICGTLQYFSGDAKPFEYIGDLMVPRSKATAIHDTVMTDRVGEINGFLIYDVIHHLTYTGFMEDNPTYLKLILVERKPGEFCAVFNDQDMRGIMDTVEPATIVNLDSTQVLATHDLLGGNGNYFKEAYWTFDHDGPIVLNQEVISQTLQKLLPANGEVKNGGAFHIDSLSYASKVWRLDDGHCCPSAGSVSMQFGLKDHQLVVVSQKYTPLTDTQDR